MIAMSVLHVFKSSQRSQQVVLDEDDDGDASYTQPTSSQVQKARENYTPVQVDRKVAEVVQFILIKDQKKIPIRRTDIVKHVIKEYKALYQDIMKRADRIFEQVFGLKLVEIDAKNHIYILINKLQPVPGEPISMCPGNPKTGLLFVILSVIFMKGGTVKESEYLEYLRIPHTEPLEHEFRWGQRAEKEVSKMKVLEFVGEVSPCLLHSVYSITLLYLSV
uniref:MAGE domain-containing protein n=1 Tax=Astyanax mexicanus TaxID=7994 RepID=A0A8B9K5H8_ASTMX